MQTNSAEAALPADLQARLGAIWRQESARIVATVLRRVRDLGLAEEMAQDAWLAALEHWPRQGLPDNPAAWLMTTAQRRALDWLRHRQMASREGEALAQDLAAQQRDHTPDPTEGFDHRREQAAVGGDELLRLMFLACHPVLPPQARVALTLKVLGGLSTAEIARAFLVSEPTLAQRLVRAKRTLAQERPTFELPRGAALAERLSAVLESVYLIFNEGYAATHGDDWMRPALCDEALRLGRLLTELAPQEPEVWGLLALMELQGSRAAARCDDQGQPVLLADQDRRLWDQLRIRRGLDDLAHAEALTDRPGAYQLQARIAACHARAARLQDTDWARIAAGYRELMSVAPSPVVALNHAVAVGQSQGPAQGLALTERLVDDPALSGYPWLPAVRGDLLERLGQYDAAAQAFDAAAALQQNRREAAQLSLRARACRQSAGRNGASDSGSTTRG